MTKLNALVLGGVAWNTMVYVDEFPPPVADTVFARGIHETVGSSGAGKALNLARLGADVTLWALVGEDEAGSKIRDFMQRHGVHLVAVSDEAGTMRHVNLMNRHGERISIWGAAGSFEVDIDTAELAPRIKAADIVSLTIMNYCRQFLPTLADLGQPVSIDIHDYDGVNSYHQDFIEAADFLFMNSLLMPSWRDFLESRIAAGTSVAVCTHGAEGASGLARGGEWVEVPAQPVDDVVDTNGAGDAFYAGFMTAWIGGAGLEDAMSRGVQHAALAIRSPELAPLE
jgi:sugar/nucleoside kinase (ribokinase family)